MKKEIIELERYLNHIKGWSYYSKTSWTDSLVLNKIVEWSQGKNVSIYRHLVRYEEEPREGTFRTKTGPVGGTLTEKEFPACDLAVYLDIYYQEKY